MSWWKSLFNKTPAVQQLDTELSPDEPAPEFGFDINIGFANGERSWTESANLIECLFSVVNDLGYQASMANDHVVVGPGLKVVPKMTSFQPLEPNGIRVATLVFTECAGKIPSGVFEYQYAAGENVRDALCQALKTWATVDLPVFVDYLNNSLDTCTTMDIKAPPTETHGATVRRVLFGPPTHMANATQSEIDEQKFCPCCLLTNCIEAFKPLLDGDEFSAVRLLAMRSKDGSISADCRINGQEFEAGKRALEKYATTWPGQYFDMRKQYVVIQPRRGMDDLGVS